MRFTLVQLMEEVVQVLDGTCTRGCWEQAVEPALFNLISAEYPRTDWMKHTNAISKESEALEAEATKMLDGEIERFMDLQSFGLCPDCGWWSTDLVYSNGQTDESVCDECECEDEE